MTFAEFLKDKDINYRGIDYTRMPRVYGKIKDKVKLPKIIHIIGTNGKGSTGRFIALMLKNANFLVGHYTSPHILDFSERIWIDGNDIDTKMLDNSHEGLTQILSLDDIQSLSYFEYTTLIAIISMRDCDFVVLEAGLGGEYDATSVFKNILTVVTPIGFDHESYLGNDIKTIATTKLKAVQKEAVVAKQPFNEVYEVLENLGIKYENSDINVNLDKIQIPNFLKQNLKTAMVTLWKLGISADTTSLQDYQLKGRCQKIKDNIIIDVGHNVLAAQALVNELVGQEFILVFNMLEDKKVDDVLEILKPIIKHIEIIDISSPRALSKEKLYSSIAHFGFEIKHFDKINSHESYLVFGSFLVIESFLRKIGYA